MRARNYFSLLAGSLTAILLISIRAHAATAESEWGDTNYSHPAPAPEVIPMTPADAQKLQDDKATDNDEIASTISSAELMSSEPQAQPAKVEVSDIKTAPSSSNSPPSSNSRSSYQSPTDISSVQNTYGVETEERKSVSLYAAPFGGVSSMLGNNSADSSSQFAAGATVGLLINQYFLVDATFTHVETNFSNPAVNSTGVNLIGGNVYLLTQNVISGGGRFFVLGRESRIRPFIGGGFGYSSGSLNYTSTYATLLGNQAQYTNDLSVNEFLGYGEVGAEVAITRQIVASASFQVSGPLSSSVGGGSTASADATRENVANSISQTASYTIAAGVGFYF